MVSNNFESKYAETNETLPLVSIVIPTFRRTDVLPETLVSLSNLNYPKEKFEVIVVDDGSNDSTKEVIEMIQNELPNLIYHLQKNSGVATARNNGARLAKGDILIFNDDDIIVPADLINKHLNNLNKFGKCLVNGHWEFASGMMSDLENTPFGQFRIKTEVWVKTGIDKKQIGENLFEPSNLTACSLGIRREDFWEIGGFDEQFPYAGCEDQEFSLRAKKAGYKFIYDYDLRLWHNDRRMSLEQFGERQQRGAITKVLLAVKFPQEIAEHPMIVENGLIKPNDSFKLIIKKAVKLFLAISLVLKLLLLATSLLEKACHSNILLARFYNLICGIYIFRGIREGIALYGCPLEKKARLENSSQTI